MVVIGPGISRNEETAEFVRDLVSVCSAVDGDRRRRLECLCGAAKNSSPTIRVDPFTMRVLTPHPGEMSRLTGLPTGEIQANRVQLQESLQQKRRLGRVERASNGHCQSGWDILDQHDGQSRHGQRRIRDVLSGIIAAMLAQVQHFSCMLLEAEGNADLDIGGPGLHAIYRWISARIPTDAEIPRLARPIQEKKTQAAGRKLTNSGSEQDQAGYCLISVMHVAQGGLSPWPRRRHCRFALRPAIHDRHGYHQLPG